MKLMTLRCINNEGLKGSLTIGKNYESGREIPNPMFPHDSWFCVIDDKGKYMKYHNYHFQIVD